MALLERDSQLEALNAWLAGTAGGGGCIVLTTGEAGIGKTTLLQQFAAQAAKSVRVLWGGCEALFTPHPLAPLYDIARQVGGDFPADIAGATSREIAFNATIDHLSRGPVPTVLIIEDVHWADEATLDLIKFLGRRLHRLGVMLVISYRDDEVDNRHPLRSVIGDLPPGCLRRLQLSPLSPAAVTALAEEAGRSDAGLHDITGGNPFFVTEALASGGDHIPETVRDAVIARMARLSDEAHAIVNLASLVPGRTERWLLERTTPYGGCAMRDCLVVGMVALPDGSLAFRHELARRAVEDHLALPHRQELHARILSALLDQSELEVSTARLVHHAEHAGDHEAVLRFAPLAAARAAALGAHREAAAHYASALRHAGMLPDAERAELYERRAYECYLTDQMAEGLEARHAALALRRATAEPLKEGDNLRWISRLSWSLGRKAEADRYASLAIVALEAQPPSRALAMAYSNCSQLYMLADQGELSMLWGQKAIDLATALGDMEILVHALNNVGTSRCMRLDRGGHEDLERSLKLSLLNGFSDHAGRAYTNLSTVASRLHDYEEADRYLQDGIAFCRDNDLDFWSRYMVAVRGVTRLARGDWEQAEEDAQSVIQHPRVAAVSKIPALATLGLLRARRGDAEADVPLREARDLATTTSEIQRIGPAVAASAEAAWLVGGLDDLRDAVRRGYELAQKTRDPWMRGQLAFWHWRCGGDVAGMDGLADAYALQIAGDWQGAAKAWEAVGCVYEQASALAECKDENALRQALLMFERLGAAPMAGTVRRKLRASGVRGIARGAQERTRANPHGLTARELKVLEVLVQGCRNADIARRLFVSEKTVGHHVSSILAKLDVRSRGEAAAAAARLGLCTPVGAEMRAEK